MTTPSLEELSTSLSVAGYDPTRDAEGYYYDKDNADRAVLFFEKCLTHVKSQWARKPFVLEDWQERIIRNLFGWYREEDGMRRYDTSLIFIPRKNGKSTLAAGIALSLLCLDQEPGAEVYSAAADWAQAGIVFGIARDMVKANRALSRRIEVLKSTLEYRAINGVYKVITAKAGTKHGYSPHGVVVDELHAHQRRDLVEALETGTGARKNSMIIHVSTAGYDLDSICGEKYLYACQVRDGVHRDPKFLPVIYEAPAEAEVDDPEAWEASNPNLDVSITREWLGKEAARAKRMPSAENSFRRYHLNQWTQSADLWIPVRDWDACEEEIDVESLTGHRCYAALDLSSVSDITPLTLAFPMPDGSVFLSWWYWASEKAATQREQRGEMPDYRVWSNSDKCRFIISQGDVIDYQQVRKKLNELREKYVIQEVAIDRVFQGAQLAAQLADEDGFDVYAFSQSYMAYGPATADFERMVLERRIKHNGDPVARWMMSNVTMEEDVNGNRKPSKRKSSDKIDGIVTAIMATSRLLLASSDDYNPLGLFMV